MTGSNDIVLRFRLISSKVFINSHIEKKKIACPFMSSVEYRRFIEHSFTAAVAGGTVSQLVPVTPPPS